MKVTSDDEIRCHSRVEIPPGIRIECVAEEDGHYVLSFGGWLLGDPRLVLDLHPGTYDQLLSAVQHAR